MVYTRHDVDKKPKTKKKHSSKPKQPVSAASPSVAAECRADVLQRGLLGIQDDFADDDCTPAELALVRRQAKATVIRHRLDEMADKIRTDIGSETRALRNKTQELARACAALLQTLNSTGDYDFQGAAWVPFGSETAIATSIAKIVALQGSRVRFRTAIAEAQGL